LRVVGGAWRGRPLVAPAGRGTRPTSDKVREAIFDVLQALPELRAAAASVSPAGADATSSGVAAGAPVTSGPLAGHAVLDLYAGSGALGIEALSRGAARCTFVERERAALVALRRNLAAVGATAPAARVAATDVRRALQADARAGCMYTLVLADPPYATSADAQDALTRSLGPVLVPQAVIVVETSDEEDVVLPWRQVRVKVYGGTKVVVLAAG
jgi:16S rRNA (guanine966-N2)-methyltransferase